MTEYIKFCLNMIKIYERKYPQIPTDILVDIIDVVLNRAPDSYFTYDQIQDHPEFCSKCGKCCKKIGCSRFNDGACDNYNSRYEPCREFPWYQFNGESGLMLNCDCQFANRLAEIALDKEFEKNLELLSLD